MSPVSAIFIAAVLLRPFTSATEVGHCAEGLCDETSLVQVKHSVEQASGRAAPTQKVKCRDPNNCKVFFVVDVQNGYDHAWLKKNNKLPAPEFDCGWNNGLNLPQKFFDELNEELDTDWDEERARNGETLWDFYVFTQDWLPPDGLNYHKWKYEDYLTITAGGPGANVNSKVRFSDFLNANGPACRAHDGCKEPQTGMRMLLHTKSIDDSMSDNLEKEDLAENGRPKPAGAGMSLPDKLTALGLTKDKTTIVVSGLVTERCVKAAAMTAKGLGYKAVYVDPFATQSSSLGAKGLKCSPADLETETDAAVVHDADRTKAIKEMYAAGITTWRSSKSEEAWHDAMMKTKATGAIGKDVNAITKKLIAGKST